VVISIRDIRNIRTTSARHKCPSTRCFAEVAEVAEVFRNPGRSERRKRNRSSSYIAIGNVKHPQHPHLGENEAIRWDFACGCLAKTSAQHPHNIRTTSAQRPSKGG
jgi:hypothetical protein